MAVRHVFVIWTNPLFHESAVLLLKHPDIIIVGATADDVILLDNVEVLFDVSLKQDPLRLLQGLSRNKTVVAAWSGSIDGEHMLYATPGHPEYRRYSLRDFLVVNPEAIA